MYNGRCVVGTNVTVTGSRDPFTLSGGAAALALWNPGSSAGRSAQTQSLAGFNFAQRRGAVYPKPTPPPGSEEEEQENFDNCARDAYRRYRRTYLKTSGKAVVGGIGLGVGARAFYGVGSSIGIKGAIHAAKDSSLSGLGKSLTAGVEMAHGSFIGGVMSALSGKLAANSVREANENSARLNAQLGDCKKRFPAADHSFSFLNF
jgi:hypothetical protein